LAHKLIVSIAERDKQVAAFQEVDCTIAKRLKENWQKRVDDWIADDTKANPYFLEGGKSGRFFFVGKHDGMLMFLGLSWTVGGCSFERAQRGGSPGRGPGARSNFGCEVDPSGVYQGWTTARGVTVRALMLIDYSNTHGLVGVELRPSSRGSR
jgi:hypothetical protein